MVFKSIIFALVIFALAWSDEEDVVTEECSIGDSIHKTDANSTMDIFLHWARKNGAKFPKLTINESTDGLIRGRTIQAVDDIETGEEVLFVPEHLMMSYWRARRTRIGSLVSKEAVRRKIPTLPGNEEQMLVVATFLLHESKDPTSFWKPYTDTFPKLDHIPTNFIDLCRFELKYTWTLKVIEDKLGQAMETYDMYSVYGEYPWFDYFQAYLYVDSRAFTIARKDLGLQMVPIADLLNHRHPHHVDYGYENIENKRKGYFMKARKDIQRDNEVTGTYGYPKRNGMFFASFGFMVSNPGVSAAYVHVSLKNYFPDFEKKKQILPQTKHEHLKMLEVDYIIDFPVNYHLFHIKKVFEHLRVFTQPIDMTASDQLVFDVTIESEQIMLKEFIRVLEASSDRMKSSLSEDETLLEELYAQNEKADTRMIQLVRMRLEERNVLLSWSKLANECLTILRTETIFTTSTSSDYLHKVIFPLVRGMRATM